LNKPNKKKITVDVVVKASTDIVWKRWTTPEDIVQWNHASADWHTPRAKNDLRDGGEFLYRMEAKDGSFGFDFGGIYNQVKFQKYIKYTLGDGRKVEIHFASTGSSSKVTETFEAEEQNPIEIQRAGWQAILNNFKQYAESKL